MTEPPAAHRVLGVIDEPMTAVGYVRFHQPFNHLREAGFELTTLGASLRLTAGPQGYRPDPDLLDGVSIVIFPQMVAAPVLSDGSRLHLVEPLCEEAARRGVKIVYSADDFLPELEPHNPGFDLIRDSASNLDALLDSAEGIIVTTDRLRKSLSAFGKPTYVLPNTVDPARWGRRPAASGELRVGWCGSSSHLDDVLLLLPAIRELQRRMEFRFFLVGLTDMPLRDQLQQVRRGRRTFTPGQQATAERFMELAGQLRSIRHEHTPFTDLDAYIGLLPALDLDLGLCPLLDTPFNRHKSALKFYEYAMAGSMTIASNVTPYREEVAVTVDNDHAAWIETIERYLCDGDERERELERQRCFVLEERTIDSWKAGWATVLRAIIDGENLDARGDVRSREEPAVR